MGQRYGVQITGLLAAGATPFWASSCCQKVFADDPKFQTCLTTPGLSQTEGKGKECYEECNTRINTSIEWYNNNRAGYNGTEPKHTACMQAAGCPAKLAVLQSGGECRPELLHIGKESKSCDLTGLKLSSNCSPDSELLKNYVKQVVGYFRVGGTLADRMGWGESYGISTWQYNDEHNGFERYPTLIDEKPASGPGAVGDPTAPKYLLVFSAKEYKKHYGEVYDVLFGAAGGEFHLGPPNRLVVSGPLVGADDSDCPNNPGGYTWQGVAGGSTDDRQIATGCFNSLSAPLFYQIMENWMVESYSLSSLEPDKAIVGVNVQHGGLSASPLAQTRGQVAALLKDLSNKFPTLDIWMANFGSCDELSQLGAACGDMASPGPYAHGGRGDVVSFIRLWRLSHIGRGALDVGRKRSERHKY